MPTPATKTNFHESPAQGPVCLDLIFTGDASSYFRVWVVNLCLTLCTLGLFSAWAKVRKQRYFYAHTTLDGSSFRYLGQPTAILRGRVLAGVLLVGYYLISYVAPTLKPFVLAAALVLAPWVLLRVLNFNSRYSAFRNITFRFESNYVNVLGTLYWLMAIPLLVIAMMFEWWDDARIMSAMFGVAGLLFPLWLWRLKRFVATHTSFGGQTAEFAVKRWPFYKIYLVASVIAGLAGVATGLLGYFLAPKSPVALALTGLPLYIGYLLSFAYVRAHSTNIVWNGLRVGPIMFRSTLSASELAGLYATNVLAIAASLGLLLPWAVIRTIRYRIRHLEIHSTGNVTAFRDAPDKSVMAAGAELGDFLQLDLAL